MGWARRTERAVAVVAAGVLALVGVILFVAWAWLHTGGARRTLGRGLSKQAGESVEVGHVSGSLIGGLHVDEVKVRDRHGAILLDVRGVDVHYRPWAVAGQQRRVRLHVHEVRIDASSSQRVHELARMAARLAGHSLIADPLVFDGGWLRAGKRVVPVAVRGRVAWDATTRRFSAKLAAGTPPLSLALDASPQRVDGELRCVLFTPALGPAAVTLRAHGPSSDVRIDIEARASRGRVRGMGRVDARSRRLRMQLTLGDLRARFPGDPTEIDLTGTLIVVANGSPPGAGTGVGARVGVQGHLRYQRRRVDPALLSGRPAVSLAEARRLARLEPGGRVWLSARARVERGAVLATLRMEVDDPGTSAAGRSGAAPLVLSGRFTKAPGHAGVLRFESVARPGN